MDATEREEVNLITLTFGCAPAAQTLVDFLRRFELCFNDFHLRKTVLHLQVSVRLVFHLLGSPVGLRSSSHLTHENVLVLAFMTGCWSFFQLQRQKRLKLWNAVAETSLVLAGTLRLTVDLWDSGRGRTIGGQVFRQRGSMNTAGQQQGGALRSRRGLRDRDPGQGGGVDAACWMAPGVLRRLMELPSPPLSRHQLKRLEEHRYSSAGRSLLEPLMQRYWEWLVGQVPSWIAPNLITIIGLVTNVFTTLVLVYYCPTATEQAPLWTYLLCAVGLFVYQSLDAIDGKQARRTNSSSPLGELFDHGCDSLSTVFVVLGTSIAVQLGTNPDWMFFCCFAGMFMFYCAHWQTYVSGTLRFGIIDVTEVQIFIIAMYLLAAMGGSAFWQSLIPVLNIQMKMVPAFCTLLGAVFSCTNYFRVIFTGGVGKNGSTIAGTSVLSPVLHIGSVIILAVMIYKKSAVQLFEKHPCLYILAFGFVSAKITNKLVVAHMTKSEMHLHDLAFLGPGLLFLDQYFNSFIDEYLVLWVALILSFFDLVRYCVSVCNQIACHLHIFVFKIRPVSSFSSGPH